jgi:hypothetical protein
MVVSYEGLAGTRIGCFSPGAPQLNFGSTRNPTSIGTRWPTYRYLSVLNERIGDLALVEIE